MGLYDSVYVKCPDCYDRDSDDPGAGLIECSMNRYTVEDAPPEVLEDLADESKKCPRCGTYVRTEVMMLARARKL